MTHDTPATILVAEDDDTTRTFLADELTADSCEVLIAETAADALRLLETKFPDLAVLDVGLPDGSGLEIVRSVRGADGLASRIDPETPLLVLSGRCGDTDRVRAFEAGSDDFLAKPFVYAELRARVRALLHRSEGRRRGGRVRVGALELDPASRTVRVGGRPIDLTQTEFSLLRVLASAPTTVHTKVELLRTVWGYRSAHETRTLDSHAFGCPCVLKSTRRRRCLRLSAISDNDDVDWMARGTRVVAPVCTWAPSSAVEGIRASVASDSNAVTMAPQALGPQAEGFVRWGDVKRPAGLEGYDPPEPAPASRW